MLSTTPTSRNITARIGRLTEAVSEVIGKQMELQQIVTNSLQGELNPMGKVQQLLFDYELETGQEIHPKIREAIDLISAHYNGFLDLVKDYAPSYRAVEVIATERTRWEQTHKRNEYMANAQRKARMHKRLDGEELEYQRQPQQPPIITDDDLREASEVWKRAKARQDEIDQQQSPEPTPNGNTNTNRNSEAEVKDDPRAAYERERELRRQAEEEARTRRTGGITIGKQVSHKF